MSRHTIGNKRGSVRGAPPDTYIPFGSFTKDDDPEPWQLAFKLGKHYLVIAASWIILWALWSVLWAIGIIPDNLGD